MRWSHAEAKVRAATVAAYLSSAVLLAGAQELQDHTELLDFLPPLVQVAIAALLPGAVTFLAGWRARHTPRPSGT